MLQWTGANPGQWGTYRRQSCSFHNAGLYRMAQQGPSEIVQSNPSSQSSGS